MVKQERLPPLAQVIENDGSAVPPERASTLFQDTLAPREQRQLGAHFTSTADILKIVGPTIVAPWTAMVDKARTRAELLAALQRLSRFRVLDPACGPGNFLYVAYRELKRIEARIFLRLREEFNIEPICHPVDLRNFLGIDIHPGAVAVARRSMLAAQKLVSEELKLDELMLTIADIKGCFQNADALLAADGTAARWPTVDVILGNPPFIGAKRLKPERGADYVQKLRKAYPEVPGMADYCVYWIRKAHDHLPPCTSADPVAGRAGFVATQNIRHNESRRGGLDHVVSTGTIVEAVDNQPWSGAAHVNVSIVNWVKTQDPQLVPPKRRLWSHAGGAPQLCSRDCPAISAALTDCIDVSGALPLRCNRQPKRVFQGVTPGHPGFVLTPAEQQALVRSDPASAGVIFPYLIGRELVRGNGTPQRYVIDLGTRTAEQAQTFGAAFAWIERNVLPARRCKAEPGPDLAHAARPHHRMFLTRWWRLSWDRDDLKQATAQLRGRYIAASRTQREPFIFCFVSAAVLPGDKLQIFAFDDDYSFGILQAAPHLLWYRKKAARLKNELDYNYSAESVFATYPWPQTPTRQQVEAIVAAARAVRQVRAAAQPRRGGLRALYGSLALPLQRAHQDLDEAVMDAYGFSQRVSVLEQLFALNAVVAQRLQRGDAVLGPGVPSGYDDPVRLVSTDCISAAP